jgi:hypothetical protein
MKSFKEFLNEATSEFYIVTYDGEKEGPYKSEKAAKKAADKSEVHIFSSKDEGKEYMTKQKVKTNMYPDFGVIEEM